MRRPINWITVSISLLFLVLGLSLRDEPGAAATDVITALPRGVLAFPVVRREPLTFERIPLDAQGEGMALPGAPGMAAQPLAQSPERVAEVSPALISFETTWVVDQPQSLPASDHGKAF